MTTHSQLPVALIQHACTASPSGNQVAIRQRIRQAAQEGAKLIVLQELHNSRYFCQRESVTNFELAEPIPGPSTEYFGKLAAELQVVIVCSLFEQRAVGVYHNTAVVLDVDGDIAGSYRKMHIPEDPGYHEKFYFTPGDTDTPGFQPINTSIGKLGLMVCWDQWYPEAARLMALAGADLLIYPTAIGWDVQDSQEEQQRQLDAWITVQRGHAIANGLPLLSCNRIGEEPDPAGQLPATPFWGNSFVAGPQGELIAQAGTDETILHATIDMQRSEHVRRIWPFLRDRRIDAYTKLTQRVID